ncbi:FAD-dependent oxidoreductase [Propionimicrobium sp. PCR01-08-3]|uniref:FAD-dependent oxidoreductase n=1 Tax=Propionimicrobium sp. PCR01-08-3 TaxID=3052086 RepID=UPI00255C340A|nr:FAD-dependent oxidoreductase [Propionimicrobium sp. PCR01-08-3]WIY81557.1 FAD-dependent oxidoreductase [Propionimicrobium sp. PCR01-08-3]
MSEDFEPDFDVIVIGAGIAGCVIAYQLAQQGHEVLLIERGEQPGSKNLSGGVLYCRVMDKVFPDFIHQAPVERVITQNRIQFMNAGSVFGIDYADQRLASPANAVTVLRAKLDGWLAEQCEAAGVIVMPGVRVDSLLTTETGRVVGVKAGDDELHCRVVVAADGVNSFIARYAGMRPRPAENQLAVGVKAVVKLDSDVIEDRFQCAPGEGVAYAIVGDCTQGVGGGGFLYTNTDSISIGVVLRLDSLTESGLTAYEIFDRYLEHPFVAPLIEGGEISEYGCHLVAEGGLDMVGEIAADGIVIVGEAAGLTLNTGLTVRGMDLAAGSAIAAAAAIDEAIKAGETSKTGLAGYGKRLFESFAGQDMETYEKAPEFLETDRMYGEYGRLLADVLYGVFNHDLTPRRHLMKVATDTLKQSDLKLTQLGRDGLKGVRAL